MDTLKRNDDGTTEMVYAEVADKSTKIAHVSCSCRHGDGIPGVKVKFKGNEFLQRITGGWLVIKGFGDIRLEPGC